MLFVQENTQFASQPFDSAFTQDYGSYSNLGDLFRRIGIDERMHKIESLEQMEHARFSLQNDRANK